MIYQSSVDRCNSRWCVIFDEQIVLIVVNKAADQYKFVNMTNICIYCYGVFSKNLLLLSIIMTLWMCQFISIKPFNVTPFEMHTKIEVFNA